ncbi:MAG: glutamate 5-kinase [Desulfuromonadaceae bacterium]
MRTHLFSNMKRILVKVGSGVISGNDGLDTDTIVHLTQDLETLLQRGYEVVLVSSGAVAAGKGDLGILGRPHTIPLKQAAAAIGQSRLISIYEKAFQNNSRKVAQVLLTRDDLANRRRYLNARNTLVTLLDYGIIPIINENDTVVVEEIRFGDNDNLSAMVTNLIEASLLIILSDVDGLYDRDPRNHPDARLIHEVERITPEIELAAGSEGSVLGTGGMATKIKAAKRASLYGVGTVIINGRIPGLLPRLLEGEQLGTYFHPARNRMAAKKHWIAFTKKPRGKLFIDDGAVTALTEKGKSLLPSGIRGVEGGFNRGDSVRLCGMNGEEFAKGVINYSLTELLRIMGRKSTEIEGILGYKYGDEIVHRDNLVLKNHDPEGT